MRLRDQNRKSSEVVSPVETFWTVFHHLDDNEFIFFVQTARQNEPLLWHQLTGEDHNRLTRGETTHIPQNESSWEGRKKGFYAWRIQQQMTFLFYYILPLSCIQPTLTAAASCSSP